MVFKLCIDAQKRWKKLYGFNRWAEVINGVKFIYGVRTKERIKNNKSERAV